MLLKNKLDLNSISGIQEIEDSAAELYFGGQGFTLARTQTGASFLTGDTVTSTTTPDAGLGFRRARDVELTITNNEGGDRRFAVYAREVGDAPGSASLLVARTLESGEIWTVPLTGEGGPSNGSNIAVAYGNTPMQARGRGIRLLNNLPAPIVPPCSTPATRCTPSDRRLKTDVVSVGFHEELGVELYSWKYINGDPTRYVGVMAQDLLARPDLAHAVVIAQEGEGVGYYAVNYQALGLRMTTEAEWQEQGATAIMDKLLSVCI